MIILPHQVKFL